MLGPLGIRVNQWVVNGGGVELHSPFKSAYVWKDRVVWAECRYGCPTLAHVYPGSIFEEVPQAIDIGENCYCGMYVARDISLARRYQSDRDSSVFVLVEGLGSCILGKDGFRASGVQIVKVIDVKQYGTLEVGSPQWLTLHATARNYGVGIVTWQEAKEAIELNYTEWIKPEEKENEDGSDTGL